jgi:deazaflavin-dependent oxidoreductase (nitroreductase family)
MKYPSRTFHHKFIYGIRIINKYFFNRITLFLAAHGKGPFSIICHLGRKSGRAYQTPVLASYIDEMAVIPLSYGEDVDWLKNILAQGGCEIIRTKKRLNGISPEVVDSTVALALLPDKRRKLFRRFNLEKFVQVHLIERE